MPLLLVGLVWLAIVSKHSIQEHKQKQVKASEQQLTLFRKWVHTSFAGSPQLQQWLANLPDEAIGALSAKLAEFCRELGFQLDWLLDGRAALDTALALRLQTIAAQYVESCYEAYLAQGDIQVLEVWLDYNEQPFGKEPQALAERILTQSIVVGASPKSAQNLFAKPDKEREIYIHAAVREAAEKHPDVFRSVLQTVITAAGAETAKQSSTNGRA